MKKSLTVAALCLALTSPVCAMGEVTLGAGAPGAPVKSINNGIITAEAEFDYYQGVIKSSFRSYYAMAALKQVNGKGLLPQTMVPANYADITNSGTIIMRNNAIVSKYANDISAGADKSKKYVGIIGWGMFAGQHSRLINNGDIRMYLDQDKKYDAFTVMVHPMYAYAHSTIINNGGVYAEGEGSVGSEVRGLTTMYGDMTMINNGKIRLDVKKSFMSRGFASLGDGGSVTNNGEIFNRGSSSVFGMVASAGTDLVNEGVLTVISAGRKSPKSEVNVTDFGSRSCGAYGMTSSPKSSGGSGRIVNRGKITVKLDGDNESDSEAVAAGMMIMNVRSDKTPLTLINTGVIDVSSTIKPNAKNHNQPRVSEIAISALLPEWKNTNIVIGEWATKFRDFGKKKDFIQARNCSVDFSGAKLILREGDVGKTYKITPETLITPIDADTLKQANITVTGFDKLSFAAEKPDAFEVQVKKDSKGYSVKLVKRAR